MLGDKQSWSEPQPDRQVLATEDSPLSGSNFATYRTLKARQHGTSTPELIGPGDPIPDRHAVAIHVAEVSGSGPEPSCSLGGPSGIMDIPSGRYVTEDLAPIVPNEELDSIEKTTSG